MRLHPALSYHLIKVPCSIKENKKVINAIFGIYGAGVSCLCVRNAVSVCELVRKKGPGLTMKHSANIIVKRKST